ncbi:MAG: hypothetical protein QOJ44_1785 [Acidimicrobiaceae bacterium]|jgi:hypothetical protein|nr:hypothetical protein [Acidimicrobiaceae bacterium]
MAAESRIGPIQLRFRYQGHWCVMSTSGDRETLKRISDDAEVIEGVEVPTWIELNTSGGADPDMRVRVELRDGSPHVVELAWSSGPHQSEIRQKHLRQTDLGKLAIDLYVSVIAKGHKVPDVERIRESKRIAQKFVERQRLPRERRAMTQDFLRKVAEVYRENIDRAPTKAVAEMFNVKGRMASKYVDKARQAGYLPPTTRGQKKA